MTTWIVFLTLSWGSIMADIDRDYDKREQFCKTRYSDVAARDRCLIVMDLERFQSRSIAIFNRVLLVIGPPLVGFGVVYYLSRRTRRPIARKPRSKPKSGSRK